jgi:putative transposase
LKQAELGTPVTELCRKFGISEQSFYRWKKTYGLMEPSEARELKWRREENVKLKRIVADLSLDKVMLATCGLGLRIKQFRIRYPRHVIG